MSEVVFSACRSDELARETDGHGDFTLRATRILSGDRTGLTHEKFEAAVISAFGANPAQHPELDCSGPNRANVLLEPLTGPVAPAAKEGAPQASNGNGNGNEPVTDLPRSVKARLLRRIAEELEQGS